MKDMLCRILNILIDNIPSWVALIIAIWGPEIRNNIIKPDLNATLEMQSPDSHRITIVYPQAAQKEESYYFRLRISNRGKTAAKNIEVVVLELYKKIGNVYMKDDSFLPLNLIWSHTHEAEKSRILPGSYKHCDFFHTLNMDGIELQFDTSVTPNRVKGNRFPTILKPGEYKAVVAVAADNIEIKKFIFDIAFTGKFYMEEKKMFSSDGIIVKKANNNSIN